MNSPPEDLSPREAFERYLNHKQTEATEESLQSYRYRLKLFVEWCEDQEIESIGELSGWDLDTYENHRSGKAKQVTLYGEMKVLRRFLRYLARIEVVGELLPGKVHIPNVLDEAKSSDVVLEPVAALKLRDYYRESEAVYGTRLHAWFELAWHTGARLGGLRGLDIRDIHTDEAYVEFVHRPAMDTPLKNKSDGERPVGIHQESADAVAEFIKTHRVPKYDDNGRQPLFTTQQGRKGAARNWTYQATFPCYHSECPHGRGPPSCEYKSYKYGSKCPSSRSPHHLRKSSITWQRDLGFPPDVVAQRVNASIEVIEQYYDKATPRERLERRRREYVNRMDESETTDSDSDT